MSIMSIMSCMLVLVFDSLVLYRSDVTSCTHWLEVGASMAVLMPLINERSGRGTLARWVYILFSLCCRINLPGFCSNFMLCNLKASTSRCCLPTTVTLMCTALLKMIRWKQKNNAVYYTNNTMYYLYYYNYWYYIYYIYYTWILSLIPLGSGINFIFDLLTLMQS